MKCPQCGDVVISLTVYNNDKRVFDRFGNMMVVAGAPPDAVGCCVSKHTFWARGVEAIKQIVEGT